MLNQQKLVQTSDTQANQDLTSEEQTTDDTFGAHYVAESDVCLCMFEQENSEDGCWWTGLSPTAVGWTIEGIIGGYTIINTPGSSSSKYKVPTFKWSGDKFTSLSLNYWADNITLYTVYTGLAFRHTACGDKRDVALNQKQCIGVGTVRAAQATTSPIHTNANFITQTLTALCLL